MSTPEEVIEDLEEQHQFDASAITGSLNAKYLSLFRRAKALEGKSSSQEVLLWRAVLKYARRHSIVDPRGTLYAAEVVLQKAQIPTRSSMLANFFSSLVTGEASRLDEIEYYSVLEQKAEAGILMEDDRKAADAINTIRERFPSKDSQRAQRLVAMFYEKRGKAKEAESIYQEMLKSNGSNALAMKRLVALSKSVPNNNAGTCTRLNQYLKLFPTDKEAWIELADLHTSAKRWEYAGFCYEELIILEPQNPLFHTLVSECLLKANSASPRVNKQKDAWIEALLEARRHAAHAVRMSKSFYGRALWCLAAACVATARASQSSLNGEEILVEEDLDLGNVTASPLLAEPKHNASSKPISELVAFEKTDVKELDQSLVKKDRNLALFLLARKGLQELYESTSADLQRQRFKHIGDLAAAHSDVIILPEVRGNWTSVSATLDKWGQAIADAASDGKTNNPPFIADK
eukprot:gb/GECG01016601.1/.p1 GENE.gb/GECG01016601.1/~~gb/GECG01016601.1/.p1  ORF type:complete len:462 (+),score=66.08 gb/GECG01016601.1/:1-1386(+)